jgi:hypothetical protein
MRSYLTILLSCALSEELGSLVLNIVSAVIYEFSKTEIHNENLAESIEKEFSMVIIKLFIEDILSKILPIHSRSCYLLYSPQFV